VTSDEGIRRVNVAHGVATTPTGGYHETITRFYMRVICGYVAKEEGRDLLMSADARFGWVEPDLRPVY
jgi:hypothetical protein